MKNWNRKVLSVFLILFVLIDTILLSFTLQKRKMDKNSFYSYYICSPFCAPYTSKIWRCILRYQFVLNCDPCVVSYPTSLVTQLKVITKKTILPLKSPLRNMYVGQINSLSEFFSTASVNEMENVQSRKIINAPFYLNGMDQNPFQSSLLQCLVIKWKTYTSERW